MQTTLFVQGTSQRREQPMGFFSGNAEEPDSASAPPSVDPSISPEPLKVLDEPARTTVKLPPHPWKLRQR